jgi:tripartite-type tricarboxylate transporter receptor subunit TctC
MSVSRRVLTGLLLASPVARPRAQEAPWPRRTLRAIVPFAPGGGTDVLARILCDGLATRLGQQIAVENRPGGATNIAADLVVRAPPDGYTILFAPAAMAVNPSLLPSMPYDLLRDLAPVSMVARTPLVLVVHPSVPAHSVRELVEFSQTQAQGLTAGTGGNGTIPHLATEWLRSLSGARLVHLPYRGQGQMLPDLLAGRLPVSLESVPPFLGPIRAGQVRPLAVPEAQRLPVLPEVPTFVEAGYPDLIAAAWNGVMVPAATPPAIVARLSAEIGRTLADPDIARRFADLGAVPMPGTPPAMDAFLRAEMRRWAEVVRISGARAE